MMCGEREAGESINQRNLAAICVVSGSEAKGDRVKLEGKWL